VLYTVKEKIRVQGIRLLLDLRETRFLPGTPQNDVSLNLSPALFPARAFLLMFSRSGLPWLSARIHEQKRENNCLAAALAISGPQ
jgi:hypothetical protein